ncbi:MAG TPA: phage tail sheath subtilisin-like domain-containing protein [Pyrinomonadaceae bacterium]
MPEYLSPGVYIEELAGPKPIQGVGTSTGAFVGIAERGPINSPQLITNLTQFGDVFGSFMPKAFLAYGVQHFFLEGGTRCYVVRAFKPSGPPTGQDPTPDISRADLFTLTGNTGDMAMAVLASSEGAWGDRVSVQASAAGFSPDADPQNDPRFKLSIFIDGAPTPAEVFDQLSMNEFDGATDFPNPDHVEVRINGVSKYITVIDATDNRTKITPPFFTTTPVKLTGGSDGAPLGSTNADFKPADLIGAVSTSTVPASGLNAFDAVDDINIVAIPDLVNPGFASADARAATLLALTYCTNRKDCFFVADTPGGQSPQNALAYKRGQSPFSGSAFNSKFGALYYPWIYATDPITGKLKLLPPSGAVAGSYSAADVRVGVHKAPAGTEDGYLNAAADIERIVTKGEQDTLNPEGVNVIRKFPDAGVVIWGARTLSSDPEWRYVNVRRLFNFLEESILKGTQGLVFEPNDKSLWKRIIRDVGAFLKIQWMEGKLVGDKPEKAFFVKCDEETNPPEIVDAGMVVTLIGVAPSKPAEFVIFRIRQTRAGGAAEE